MTSNLALAQAPGNVLLESRITGLPRDSVVLVSQMETLDRRRLRDQSGALPQASVNLILSGIDRMLGRE
jgi:mRNA interferase MazF